jgi:hypothetical protein
MPQGWKTRYERFLDARDYAEDVGRDPALLARYQELTEVTKKSVYILCRDDWFKAPRISGLQLSGYNGQVGDVISVKVRDVIGAEKVIVTLADEVEGTLIERGQAVQEAEGSSKWNYTATRAVPAGTSVQVIIDAYDYPGNKSQKLGFQKTHQP